MIELEDKIQQCYDKMRELKDNDLAIQELMEIVATLNSKKIIDWTGDELSRSAMQLSLLLTSLGQLYTDSTMVYNMTYSHRKVKGAITFLNLEAGTVGEKNAIVQRDTEGIYKDEVYANYRSETLKSLYKNIERIVSVIQTRIRLITH